MRVSYRNWEEAVRSLATFWNMAFNGQERMTRGVDTKQDVIIDDNPHGLVLKSPDGHYWRLSVSNLGAISTTDLGLTKP